MKNFTKSPNVVLFSLAFAGVVLLSISLWQQSHRTIPAKHLDRKNPWSGLPGCLYFQQDGTQTYWPLSTAMNTSCVSSANDAIVQAIKKEAAPVNAQDLLMSLQPWIASTAFNSDVEGHLSASTKLGELPKGDNVYLTIDPQAQSIAQSITDCMAGKSEACVQSEIDQRRWQHMQEAAAYRMAGMLQIDVATGRIEMFSSADSRCYRQFHSNQPRDAQCLELPPQIKPAVWRLQNHALHGQGMPASGVKLVLALGLLRAEPKLDTVWLEKSLQESDTPEFINKLLCKDQNFSPDCQRTKHLHKAALDLGFNSNELGILLGTSIDTLHNPSPRLFQTLTRETSSNASKTASHWAPMHLQQPKQIQLLKNCAKKGWSQCKGEQVANLLAEFWGQGQSLATPIGLGNMMQTIASASNGSPDVFRAHLVDKVETAKGILQAAGPISNQVKQHEANAILRGLQMTHQPDGTAFSACMAVFKKASRCQELTWLAGKTATPVFKHDKFTAQQRQAYCKAMTEASTPTAHNESFSKADYAHCAMSPYKWYLAILKSKPGAKAPWSKVIISFAERNYQLDGKIDSQYDKGSPNVAAELAMRYIKANFDQQHQ